MSDSIQSLLDRDLPPDYRREVTEHVAAEPGAVVTQTESVVIFRVHREWLALSTMVFQGVAPAGPVHALPHRRDGALLGITHLQGELLVCMSLGVLLGLSATKPVSGVGRRSGERLMIVKGEGGSLAIPVQEVHGVYRYRPEELREVPATLAHADSRYTIGMLPWEDRWVARLDDGLVFHAISRVLS